MATRAREITFLVPGQADTAPPAGATRGSVKSAVRVGTLRGAAAPERVTARVGEDVIVLSIVDGPTLVLHPDDARDLMRAQQGGATRGGPGSRVGDEVVVPVRLAWPGIEAAATRDATRGWLGQAALGAFHVITGLLKDPAVTLAAAAITRAVDGKVEAGVYGLSADALPKMLKGSGRLLAQVPAAPDGGPLLVLVHGTFVDTVSTFGKLWEHQPQTVQALFTQYDKRVYALDHPTMGASPIANALTLVQALPAGARLHLVTHSRGGLVAEVLARACSGAKLAADELKLFNGDGYGQHRADLQALYTAALAKQIKIERVVRVACPARGTLLASKRFDAYLSVLQWGLKLAQIPVAPELVDFLHEVARRRAKPDELPGIEAMMPESPVVAWLNGGNQLIPGELRVIAGDMQGDSIGSWVKTLLTDAFYWTDNDIVVQTRSMYGGAPRAATAGGGGASFVLDRGAQVTHFNYFSNDNTVNAIRAALQSDAPAGFQAIGPLSWAGQDASGTRGLTRAPPAPQPDKPAVFVLPGILGSNLAVDGTRVWLGFHFLNGLKKLAWDPATASRVTPDGPIGLSYDALITHLGDTHEVIPFAYDWRRPIEDEARRLADAVEAALDARAASGEPVRLLAHSMGGLVARTMRLERPKTWSRMMAVDGARLLMLGTPNGGSWAPMQTLSGDDTFGNALVAFGSIFDNGGARKMMAGMPGFIQLQAALLEPAQGLDQAATWQKLADDDMAVLRARSIWHDEGAQRTIYEWGAPPQAVLDQAVALRKRLDAQVPTLAVDSAKMLLVVGHADQTPVGIVRDANDGLEYLEAADGDGRVPLPSALLPGVRTWKLDAEHGKLPDVASAFDAYVELLANGETSRLEAFVPAAAGTRGQRGAAPVDTAALTRSRPSRGLHSSLPPSSAGDVLGTTRAGSAEPARGIVDARGETVPLHLQVLNGDLKFVHQPLLIGHYRSLKLSGTEEVVDGLVTGALTRSLDAGVYPSPPGDHKIFGNVRPDPDNVFAMARPEAVVVVGLGEEGKLKAADLVFSVRQAVIAYAQRVAERSQGQETRFELAATLIASGGTGISAGSAAQLIAQGASEAQQRLAAGKLPLLSQLTLVELYLERASDAWRALRLRAEPGDLKLQVDGKVRFGPGAMRRSLDTSYRGTSYDFISATTLQTSAAESSIVYTLDTRRARTEVRAQKPQVALLRELVQDASNDANGDARIGRTLFNLLVPVEIEPFLGGSAEMLLELDAGTAAIPWELLDTDAGTTAAAPAQKPWAIRSKLLRKLRVDSYRVMPTDAGADDSVLVIGEPKTEYAPLPGARAEARAVMRLLTQPGVGIAPDHLCALVDDDDGRAVINALFERPYRIVHVAGHGAPGRNGGVVLSGKNMFLGANEVEAMRVVPELVFLNCCHLAGGDPSKTLSYDRADFAANIAEALIRVGVRCVIAAGWAVEDGPAEKFATAFYAALLNGERFIEAVAAAREAAWDVNPNGNTWAAYQCYGDPEWVWRREGADAQRPAVSLDQRYAEIASPMGLSLALENLAIMAKYWPARAAGTLAHVRYLDQHYGMAWRAMGAVAEAFGLAYAAAGDADTSIDWYERAVNAGDGSASFRAAEQLGNQLARRGDKLRGDDARARRLVERGITLLQGVTALQPTVERESLLGSAYKRLVMIEGRAKRRAAALLALELMATHYGNATQLARATGADNLFYPAKNGISAVLRLAYLQQREPAIAANWLGEVHASLDHAASTAPDFWSVAGQIEIKLIEALMQHRLAAAAPALIDEFRALKARVPATDMWDSVHNEAQFTLEPYQVWQKTLRPAQVSAAAALLRVLKSLSTAAPQAPPAPIPFEALAYAGAISGVVVTGPRAIRGADGVRADPSAELLKDPRNLPLWFATNREPVNRADIGQGFSGQRSTDRSVQHGRCIVNVPQGHQLGSTGSTGLGGWFMRLRHGDDRLRVRSIEPLDKANFWSAVQAALGQADAGSPDALLFVHGFRVTFEDAAVRAAQLAYDLKIRDAAFFSWPSAGKAARYPKDEVAAKNSVGPFADFLLQMDSSAHAAGKALHLIAHSMGNRVLLGALRKLVLQGRTLQAIDKIVCAAPDEDAVEFAEGMEELLGVGRRRTLYASAHDKPLWLSEVLHGDARAGRIPPVTRANGLDTVDASGLEATFLGHSDFATERPLLSDLFSLLKSNLAPELRIGLEPATGPDGAGYWRIK